jgi:predicted nucleotidyltransferase
MSGSVSVPPLADLRRAAASVAERHELDLVILFGSAARGDAPAPHDLDIGVLSAGSRLADMLALTNAFIEQLHIQALDLVDLRTADPVLLIHAAREGVALFEARSSTFAEFVSLAARRFADTKKFRDSEEEYLQDFLASRKGGR